MILISQQDLPLNEKNVADVLSAFNVNHQDVVIAQFKLETGNFKCKDCSLQFNNIPGFLTKTGYMKFDSWIQSIIYYKYWQDRYHKCSGKNDYFRFLKRVGYATEETYEARVKSMMR